MNDTVSDKGTFAAEDLVWSRMLQLPEVAELRRRRKLVTTTLGGATIALFTSFLIAWIGFPDQLGSNSILGFPLSIWVVFSQFAGTWVMVWAYFRLSRTYIEPASDAAIRAVTDNRPDSEEVVA
ncbi:MULTISPECIES: DUF485 domain-containing protein [unclassified Rhodococcus (in: high G+C Gram-positive bacteria)]|uniref:DUF485 domain-containing protein n=1 Tax=Rhodococcus sp. SJ-3 TaxID=3454628 RepID=UPI003F79008A